MFVSIKNILVLSEPGPLPLGPLDLKDCVCCYLIFHIMQEETLNVVKEKTIDSRHLGYSERMH